MSDSGLDPETPLFVNIRPNRQVVVMAELAEKEFGWAQVVVPDLNEYASYEDWLDQREGLHIGQAMAGVDVRMTPVALSPFLAWCRLTRTKPSEYAIDLFAAVLFALCRPPSPIALAHVGEDAFRTHLDTITAFALHHDFQQWARHRAAVRTDIIVAGARAELLPVNLTDFVEWSRCLGGDTSELSLDRYAALVLEFLTQDTTTDAKS
jgi:hypothetical protein